MDRTITWSMLSKLMTSLLGGIHSDVMHHPVTGILVESLIPHLHELAVSCAILENTAAIFSLPLLLAFVHRGERSNLSDMRMGVSLSPDSGTSNKLTLRTKGART